MNFDFVGITVSLFASIQFFKELSSELPSTSSIGVATIGRMGGGCKPKITCKDVMKNF